MIGEWSWQTTSGGGLAWLADKLAAWASAGVCIEIQWNYDVMRDSSVNRWAARPGGTWIPAVQAWMRAS